MRIGLGSDEIGFECKELLKARFSGQGHAAEDVSTGDLRRTDYQSIANELASAIYTGRVERGVLICSRAIGASVMANKHPGVRAALCHDLNSARHGVQDDDMNLLHDGSRRRDARSGVRVGGRLYPGLVRSARADVWHSSAAFGARRRVHPKQSGQTARR